MSAIPTRAGGEVISTRVPADTLDALRERAIESDRTLAGEIRRALRIYTNDNGRRATGPKSTTESVAALMFQSSPEAGLRRLRDAALALAADGRPVFPVGLDKRPLTTHGLLDATTDSIEVAAFWDCWPSLRPGSPVPNVAMRTGEASGLVVLDVDGQEGADSLHDLEAQHGALPATTSVATPRGGAHYYFRWPGVAVKTTAGALGLGLDVRGDGGYVLVPPSRTAHGRYEWDATVAPAEMPSWLKELARAERSGRAAPKATGVAEWVARLRTVPERRRNTTFAQLAGLLLGAGIDRDITAELLLAVNADRSRPPLPAQEVERIVTSIAGCERRKAAVR